LKGQNTAMSRTTLSSAKSGDRCVVLEIASDPPEMKSRLYALGIIPGSAIELLRFAPLGDPMQVKVGGSFVSIRKSEAKIITVDIQ
jgi:ferrous iron transport protein A